MEAYLSLEPSGDEASRRRRRHHRRVSGTESFPIRQQAVKALQTVLSAHSASPQCHPSPDKPFVFLCPLPPTRSGVKSRLECAARRGSSGSG